MTKKTVAITWTESVIYSAEIEIDWKEDEPPSESIDNWFEIFEANARPDWRQQVDEVEHRMLLSMDDVTE